ncbi:MAG: DUF4190 domain-containing protein [Schumannella sp.]|nr:DUF4190 domain-containing protein [Microbacteriaceae bacterium]
MTACVKCSRALQPAWKFCIYCGTRVEASAPATRSRPLPQRTRVGTTAAPIVPPPAPAPLSAAPVEPPVSSEWPEDLGERPSLRSALAATEVPMPTPPVEDAPPPEGEVPAEDEVPAETRADDADTGIVDAVAAPEDAPAPEVAVGDAADHDAADDAPADDASDDEVLPPDADDEDEDDDEDTLDGDTAAEDDDEPADRTGSVNTLAILALLIGILACPLAAPFGHLALGQVRNSGERGTVPAWIAIVLGYLWLGFWIVFVITYFATNG